MARLYTCCSFHCNPLPGGEDELIRALPGATTKGSNTSTLSLAISQAPTPTSTPTPTPAPPSTNKLFKQFMKTYLKSN